MFTFAEATDLHRKFVEFYASGKVTAALCHGTSGWRCVIPHSGLALRPLRQENDGIGDGGFDRIVSVEIAITAGPVA
jgi:putative intracellular protease/amidase